MDIFGGPLYVASRLPHSARMKLYRMEKKGRVLRLQPGVFVDSEVWQTLSSTCQYGRLARLEIVAAAARSQDAVIVGRSAATVRGLARPTNQKFGSVVELGTSVSRSNTSRSGARLHYLSPSALRESELVTVEGAEVRLSSPRQMCAELLLWATIDEAVVAIEDAFARKLLNQQDIAEVGLLIDHRRGAAAAREVLRLVTPYSESPRESEVKLAMWRAGLPAPFQQAVVRDHEGRFVARVDFLFPCGLIFEYDGRAKYLKNGELGEATVDPAVIASERRRERALQNLAFVVMRGDAETFADPELFVQVKRMLDKLSQREVMVTDGLWRAPGAAWS